MSIRLRDRRRPRLSPELDIKIRIHSSRARWRVVRILLADDHPGFPELEKHLINPEFQIMGVARNGSDLVEQAMRLEPDIVITDISMPILNGVEAAKRLRNLNCRAKIIFLTVHADPEFIQMCLAAGAMGYVLKSRMASELMTAIRAVQSGGTFVSPLPESHNPS